MLNTQMQHVEFRTPSGYPKKPGTYYLELRNTDDDAHVILPALVEEKAGQLFVSIIGQNGSSPMAVTKPESWFGEMHTIQRASSP